MPGYSPASCAQATGRSRRPLAALHFNQGQSIVIKIKATLVNRLPITRARINLGQVVKRAHLNKEYFILEKDGIPVAGIMSADELEDYLEMRDPAIREQIKKSNADVAAGRTRPAGDLLTELRTARTARQKRSAKR